MSGYLSFFTPFEKYVMNNRINLNNGPGSLSLGFRYTVFCYMLFSFVFIAGFVNVIAEGMHNTKQMNKDAGINIGITSTQITLGSLIVLFSIAVAGMHYSHNKMSYVEGLGQKYDIYAFIKSATTEGKNGGFGITYSIFTLFIVFIVFCYGFMLLIFSADRLVCTTSSSATCNGITKLDTVEKNALRV
jgi:hypothetical protein